MWLPAMQAWASRDLLYGTKDQPPFSGLSRLQNSCRPAELFQEEAEAPGGGQPGFDGSEVTMGPPLQTPFSYHVE